MIVSRSLPILTFAAAALSACSGPSKKQQELAVQMHVDSVAYLKDQLYEQAMQATQFVNEINKQLAKARSMSTQMKVLASRSELADVNEERNQTLARVTQLVERLDAAHGRIAGLRKQIEDKDSTLALKAREYETMVAEANENAERQRAELQAVIDGQVTRISTLTRQVDTLSGTVSQLSSELNAVYVISGTEKELVKKGVLVPEGRKQFLIAGSRRMSPSRDLDATLFTRIDRRTDSTIYLPDGVYRIASRQNPSYTTPTLVRSGKITGGLRIDDPEKFWNGSRYLILVKS